MPKRFKVVCIPCKALYKCSALLCYIILWFIFVCLSGGPACPPMAAGGG